MRLAKSQSNARLNFSEDLQTRMKTITYDDTKYKLVPVKPTPEMVTAGTDDLRLRGYDRALIVAAIECYRSMLSAAPEAQAQPAPVQQKPMFADLIAKHPGLAEELKGQDKAFYFGYESGLAVAQRAMPECGTPAYCKSVKRCTADDEHRAVQPAAPVQEPCSKCHGVGYYDEGHENDDGSMSGGNYVECEKCKPPAAQTALKPLTYEQIDATLWIGGLNRDSVRRFARAIEAAHGITEKGGAA